MMCANVNFWVVGIVALVGMLFGLLWYSPFAFGKAWAQEVKLDYKKMNFAALDLVSGFALSFVMAYVYACFMSKMNVAMIVDSLSFSFWIWLGFMATIQYSGVIWAKKSPRLFVIDAGYWLVNLCIMGILLTFWK